MKFNLRYKIWFENDDATALLGEGKIRLLKRIQEHGCLKQAAEEMGWTYRTTWNNLKKIENKLGYKLTTAQRGGKGGGGKLELTPEALELLRYYDYVNRTVGKKMKELISEFEKKSRKRVQ
jgi:molybdate transport system regulatory protein